MLAAFLCRPFVARSRLFSVGFSMTTFPRSRFGLYLDLIRWDRPAGWLVCLWPTLSALWVAADGFPGWHLLAVFVLGTILMRSAGLLRERRGRPRL
jgi:hypothetical protein